MSWTLDEHFLRRDLLITVVCRSNLKHSYWQQIMRIAILMIRKLQVHHLIRLDGGSADGEGCRLEDTKLLDEVTSDSWRQLVILGCWLEDARLLIEATSDSSHWLTIHWKSHTSFVMGRTWTFLDWLEDAKLLGEVISDSSHRPAIHWTSHLQVSWWVERGRSWMLAWSCVFVCLCLTSTKEC